MTTQDRIAVAGVAAAIGVLFVAICGWCMNLHKITQLSFDPITAEGVLRVAGIFVPPLGAVMGWF